MQIACCLLLIGGIACAVLPQDLVEVSLRPVVDVKVDKELMGNEWANIDKLLGEANITSHIDLALARAREITGAER
jgi:hypothetical protein